MACYSVCHVTFSRVISRHLAGRFEARIGISGSKHVYLGLFVAEIEAARAYDRAAVRIAGLHASTNLQLSDYSRQLTEHELKKLEVCHSLLNSACAEVNQHIVAAVFLLQVRGQRAASFEGMGVWLAPHSLT